MTGLDYSSAAITEARALAATAGLAATFVEADLYDAPARIDGLFDVVFVNWGAINWLRDIRRWAQIVAGFLAPGGYLYFIDSHPVTLTLEWVQEAHLQPTYPYFSTDQPLEFETETSYNEDGTKLTHTKSYEWMHGISDVVMALLDAGLRLDFLHEHDRLAWRLFPCMQPTPEHDFKLPDTMPSLPLAYSLKASKPG